MAMFTMYLNKIRKSIKHLLFFDNRVVYSFIYRASQVLVGIITIFVITHWFKQTEQGYYYTFNSLLALQIIFEMGLSFVVLQFSGHEFAVINWSPDRKIQGPPEKVHEFSLFIAKCCKIYALIAVDAFCIIGSAGFLFFNNAAHTSPISWKLPWFFLCLATTGNIFLTPILAIIEGSGRVKHINQFRTIQNTFGAAVMWLAMMSNLHLYSVALDAICCFLVTVIWLVKYYNHLLIKAYEGLRYLKNPAFIANTMRWSKEIWPMQWRIGISWIAGYFLNQIFTPIIFYYHDAVSAGKLGMSLSLCNMLSLFSITILAAYNPEICQLIANKKWNILQPLFKKLFLQSLFFTTLIAALIILIMSIPMFNFITYRLISIQQMTLLLLGVIINFMIGSIALFLRAFKKEPFVWVSLLGAILNSLLAWWFGKLYSITGICLVYFLLNLFYGLPTAWFLWRKNTANLWTYSLQFSEA